MARSLRAYNLRLEPLTEIASMGFFAIFWTWLNGQLATYIGDNTARLASILEPTIVTLATIYVMVWGYLHLTGKIEEPVLAGLKRIAVVGGILGVALHLWLYNALFVDTFYRAPAQLAAALLGAADPISTIDTIWDRGGAVADSLWRKGTIFGFPGFYLAGAAVWLLIGALCVYAMFLIALSSIALAVLLALGPLFMACLFFDGSRRFFSAWVAQLANYGLITVLTVMVATLLLRIVQSYAVQTAARGSAILTVDALNMLLVAAVVFLVMRQVMPIAAALAGGLALNSFGMVSGAVRSSMRMGMAAAAPAAAYAAPRVGAGVARVAGGASSVVRNAGRSARQAAAHSSQYVYRKAGSGLQALQRRMRSRRR